jgi:putative zinc finger/helix-turn-helix YgiT family protein
MHELQKPGCQIISYGREIKATCPECESASTGTRIEAEHFTYGIGADAVELTAAVPIRRCHSCGLEWLDYLGEQAKHQAICRHIGVLTPSEITEIRTKNHLSKAKFASLTKIGVATLARWERGILIQSPGYDMFLRLLQHPDNIERLKRLHRANIAGELEERFASITDLASARRQQTVFRLIAS